MHAYNFLSNYFVFVKLNSFYKDKQVNNDLKFLFLPFKFYRDIVII